MSNEPEIGVPVSPEPAAPPPKWHITPATAATVAEAVAAYEAQYGPMPRVVDDAALADIAAVMKLDPFGPRVVDTPTADVLRRLVAAVPGADGEIYCPSVDGCCFCGDCECDGIACIAALDPDDENDHEAIGQLHAWLRRGRLWEQAENFLAVQENRAGVRRG